MLWFSISEPERSLEDCQLLASLLFYLGCIYLQRMYIAYLSNCMSINLANNVQQCLYTKRANTYMQASIYFNSLHKAMFIILICLCELLKLLTRYYELKIITLLRMSSCINILVIKRNYYHYYIIIIIIRV